MSSDQVPLCSSNEVSRALTRAGFAPRGKSKGGSHQAWTKTVEGRTFTAIVVLAKREIPRETLRSIIKQTGMTIAEFRSYLK